MLRMRNKFKYMVLPEVWNWKLIGTRFKLYCELGSYSKYKAVETMILTKTIVMYTWYCRVNINRHLIPTLFMQTSALCDTPPPVPDKFGRTYVASTRAPVVVNTYRVLYTSGCYIVLQGNLWLLQSNIRTPVTGNCYKVLLGHTWHVATTEYC